MLRHGFSSSALALAAIAGLACAIQQSRGEPAVDASTDPHPETLASDLRDCFTLAEELTGYQAPRPLSTRTHQRTTVRLKEKEAFDQAYTSCLVERGHEVLAPGQAAESVPASPAP